MLYLSPVWNVLQPQWRPRFGYITPPESQHGPRPGIYAGFPWMMDNGCFSSRWTESKWITGLEHYQKYTPTCIAAVCPDVVGDAAATLARFQQYAPVIRRYGYTVAFVTQDGLAMDSVPWSDFDVLFVGGTDQHKLGESMPFVVEAKRRGKWVHVGRVNSVRRMHQFWIADSCDGTTLAISPDVRNQRKFIRAMEEIRGKKLTCSMF